MPKSHRLALLVDTPAYTDLYNLNWKLPEVHMQHGVAQVRSFYYFFSKKTHCWTRSANKKAATCARLSLVRHAASEFPHRITAKRFHRSSSLHDMNVFSVHIGFSRADGRS